MSNQVSFDEFQRIDFRVGKIVEVKPVPGAKKLVSLAIDIGGQTKQSVAGLGGHYNIEELKSKLVAVVVNLKPRKVFGLESEVMLLAALDGDVVSILQPDRDVSPGSKIT